MTDFNLIIEEEVVQIITIESKGDPGTPGVGVPAGGTAGQFLAKLDPTDFNTQWETVTREFGITIDGAGQVILTGEKGVRPITYPMTITGWKLNADQAGDIVIDVLNNGASIAGATKPTLAAQQKATGDSADWTKALAENDEISFVVDSVSGVIRATLIITAIQAVT